MAQAQDAGAPYGREPKRVKTEHGLTDTLASPPNEADGGVQRSSQFSTGPMSSSSQSWLAPGNPMSNGSSFANTPDALQTPVTFSRTDSGSRMEASTAGAHANAGLVNDSAARSPSGFRNVAVAGRKEEATSEVDQLQDLLGMSGVDLRAEEEAIHGLGNSSLSVSGLANRQAHTPVAQASPFYLELYPLSQRIHKIAAQNNLDVEPEVLLLLSRAAKLRFQNLLQAMIAASRHRQWSSHLRTPPLDPTTGKPLYHEEIHDDPTNLLSALRRVEKVEELAAREARLEREEMEARVAAGQVNDENRKDTGNNVQGQGSAANGDGTGPEEAKRKGKKLGASAAARNMTEDKRLKLANNTAARALGINTGSKAWMFSGIAASGAGSGADSPSAATGGAARLPKPRFAPVQSGESGKQNGGEVDGAASLARSSLTNDGTNPGGWGDLGARQRRFAEEQRERVRRVNLEDALHALEMERKGGAGRGSGERVLFATRVLGRPTLPSSSSTSH